MQTTPGVMAVSFPRARIKREKRAEEMMDATLYSAMPLANEERRTPFYGSINPVAPNPTQYQ